MDSEKLSNRQKKALETKDKIYKAAYLLFKNYGFDNVSVDSIVESAGVSKGTFYVHFDSKSSLIHALSVDLVDDVDSDYKDFVESLLPSTNPSDILILFAEKISTTITDVVGYDLIKATYEAQITRKINIDESLKYSRDLYQTFNKIISIGIEKEEFKSTSPVEVITKQCIVAIRGLTYEWCIRYPDFDLKSEVRDHFSLLLEGIKK
ncbi:TetR/AcrR family transcriptional regulator [Tissierella sp.]|uniref:TetR/AcrR family transcriptional regulator n=1 Tax=Tissierella sp. TaxID=41274 RepID=UPI0028601CB4|nr:TetR/AcrR family transcriptional regulator [Tissierella sp.]MDR7857566.1 TetR/AcrR family transcriptional regulator [Tissierella sp.]